MADQRVGFRQITVDVIVSDRGPSCRILAYRFEPTLGGVGDQIHSAWIGIVQDERERD